MSSKNTKRATEIANCLAISVVLEFVSNIVLPQFQFGTGISLVSCVPILLVSYRHGIKWGILSGCLFGFMQILFDQNAISRLFKIGAFGSQSYMGWIMMLLDYIVAFGAVGLGGIFRRRGESRKKNFMQGSLIAMGASYAIHIFSGWLVYPQYMAIWYFNGHCDINTITLDSFAWAPQGLLSVIFTVFYNSIYMLPNIALITIAAWILSGNRRLVTRVKYH